MKPYQILAFFFSIVLVLLMLSMVFPEDGIRINNNLKIRFFNIHELFRDDSIQYADISVIIQSSAASVETRTEISDSASNETRMEIPVSDRVNIPDSLPLYDTLRANAESLKSTIRHIEFPNGKTKLFHPFFERASSLKTSRELLRILHYGDSQIETDRITSYLRNRMQLAFGGSGCGLVPAIPLYNGKMSISQDYSANWQRFTGFAGIDTSLGHRRFGALFSFASMRQSRNPKLEPGWIELRPSPIAYTTAKRFNQLSLFMGNDGPSPVAMKLYLNDSLVNEKLVEHSFTYQKFKWNLGDTPEKLKLEFNPESNLSLFGVSLDNSWGIAMDNIPLRGSSGLEFSKTDTVILKKMYKDLNVGMLILQFGGNVVPYLESVSAYKRYFMRELAVLKRLLPGVPVLVVGPSDMSVKEKGRYMTYPNLEKVRDALRRAALDSGCSFWDMYEAMGGRNSMPSWVFAEPPLAVNDFVHFNIRGSRIIAEMLYNSIIYEYNVWGNREELSRKQ